MLYLVMGLEYEGIGLGGSYKLYGVFTDERLAEEKVAQLKFTSPTQFRIEPVEGDHVYSDPIL